MSPPQATQRASTKTLYKKDANKKETNKKASAPAKSHSHKHSYYEPFNFCSSCTDCYHPAKGGWNDEYDDFDGGWCPDDEIEYDSDGEAIAPEDNPKYQLDLSDPQVLKELAEMNEDIGRDFAEDMANWTPDEYQGRNGSSDEEEEDDEEDLDEVQKRKEVARQKKTPGRPSGVEGLGALTKFSGVTKRQKK